MGLSLDYDPDLDANEGAVESNAVLEFFATNRGYWPEDAGYDDSVSCLNIKRLPEVVEELIAVGFDQHEISGILGSNFRRVAEQVWK